MNAALLYPFILVAGALQALGNSMNARLRDALVNPWLAATYSFMPIVIVFTILFFTMPTPLPTLQTLARCPGTRRSAGWPARWRCSAGSPSWTRSGAGPFNGLTITANILTSLALDSLGLFGLQAGGFKPMPWLGGLLMVVGIVFIARATGPKSDDETAESREGGLMAKLLYPFILVAGSLQAVGVVLNAQLRGALVNPWLAATVSFVPVALVFLFVFLLRPTPLPTRADVARVPWWGALGGIAGAVAVFAACSSSTRSGPAPSTACLSPRTCSPPSPSTISAGSG